MTDITASSDVLKVTLLGTGIPNPQINAFGTSTLIEAGDQKVLIDCGRGAAIRLSQIGLGVGCVDTIFISHYHSDHFSGLFDMAMTGSIPQKFGGRTGPLHVHGPSGIADIAEDADHHPQMLIKWGSCQVSWSTHDVKALQQLDFIMAAKCDQLFQRFST